MNLGEITGGGARAYYRLENLNDTGPNGFNLTNNNVVTFGSGRFSNAADFGSSGTNKALTYAGDILNGAQTEYTFSFWFKLNNTVSNNGTAARFFTYTSTSMLNMVCEYGISGSNLIVRCTPNNAVFSLITIPKDTNWHHCTVRRTSDNLTEIGGLLSDQFYIQIDTKFGTFTSFPSGTGASNQLTIGNNAAFTLQAWAMIDEFVIYNFNFNRRRVYDYYKQALGRTAPKMI